MRHRFMRMNVVLVLTGGVRTAANSVIVSSKFWKAVCGVSEWKNVGWKVLSFQSMNMLRVVCSNSPSMFSTPSICEWQKWERDSVAHSINSKTFFFCHKKIERQGPLPEQNTDWMLCCQNIWTTLTLGWTQPWGHFGNLK